MGVPTGVMVQFPSNGKTAQGYLAVPESGSGPGVVVIQEWWGLVGHIEDVADRFAAAGFVALAPDLYDGAVAAEPDQAAKIMMAMELDRAARDMGGAIDYLNGRDGVTGEGIGAVGFCMGGGLVLWLSTMRPEISAAVPFYGALPWESVQPDFTTTRAAFQGHYAEDDDFATMESAREIESTLRGLGRDATFHIYPGTGHGFFNDDRPEAYVADAAQVAWDRTVSFFWEHLG